MHTCDQSLYSQGLWRRISGEKEMGVNLGSGKEWEEMAWEEILMDGRFLYDLVWCAIG